MQRLIVFAALTIAVQSVDQSFIDEFKEKATEIGIKCVEQTGASNDDIASIMDQKVPSSKEGKCMISCFYKAVGVQNDDGSLNPNGMKVFMEKLKSNDEDMYNKFRQLLDECLIPGNVLSDHCDTSAKVATCGIEVAKKVGLSSSFMKL